MEPTRKHRTKKEQIKRQIQVPDTCWPPWRGYATGSIPFLQGLVPPLDLETGSGENKTKGKEKKTLCCKREDGQRKIIVLSGYGTKRFWRCTMRPVSACVICCEFVRKRVHSRSSTRALLNPSTLLLEQGHSICIFLNISSRDAIFHASSCEENEASFGGASDVLL